MSLPLLSPAAVSSARHRAAYIISLSCSFLRRAPGSAPSANPCGLAGGTPWLPEVSEAGDYTKTKYAHHGMAGTELPPMDTGVT